MQVFSCEVSMMIETEERNIETRKEQVHIYKILDFITRSKSDLPQNSYSNYYGASFRN